MMYDRRVYLARSKVMGGGCRAGCEGEKEEQEQEEEAPAACGSARARTQSSAPESGGVRTLNRQSPDGPWRVS